MREGMLEGVTLGHYFQLVDATGRMLREGKAAISAEVAAIFERLQTSADAWQERLKMLNTARMFGRFFATTRETLKAVAAQIGARRLFNLGGCATT